MVYTPPSDGVDRLLSEMLNLPMLQIDGGVVDLYLFFWADNWCACTVIKMWLVDPSGLIFADHRSRLELICDFQGGENLLKLYLPIVLQGLLTVSKTVFSSAHVKIKVRPLIAVFNHHALSTVTCSPTGRSEVSDSLGCNQRSNWSLLADEGTTQFKVCEHTRGYNKNVKWSRRMSRLRQNDLATSKRRVKPVGQKEVLRPWKGPTELQLLAAARSHTDLLYGRFNGSPLLARGLSLEVSLPLSLFVPTLHNTYGNLRLTTELLLRIITVMEFKKTPLIREWYAWFSGLAGLTSRGELVQSFARMRRICSAMPATLEPELLGHANVGMRVYAYLARFAVYMSKHNYSPSPSTTLT